MWFIQMLRRRFFIVTSSVFLLSPLGILALKTLFFSAISNCRLVPREGETATAPTDDTLLSSTEVDLCDINAHVVMFTRFLPVPLYDFS